MWPMNFLACASIRTRMLVKVTRNVSLHSYVPNYAKITSTEPIYWTNWLNDTSCS